MKSISPFNSLKITPPFGGVLLRALILLLLISLIGESLIRAGISIHLWREPLMGSVNAEMDIKLQELDSRVRIKPVDCIFLGSSQMDAAIIPAVFSAQYKSITDHDMNCYNFSLGTLTAGPAGKIAKLLANRYRPKLLVLGISARDFSRDFGELTRPLINDPWVQYSSGKNNTTGWLLENSLLFRFMGQIRAFINPDYHEFRTGLLRALMPDGYLKREGNNLSLDSASAIPKFKLYEEDISGLDEAQILKQQGINIVFVEIPVYTKFLALYVEENPDAYYRKFRTQVQNRIDLYNLPFIYTQEATSSFIPDSGWNDVLHLNSKGAELFSRYLAKELSDHLSIPKNSQKQ